MKLVRFTNYDAQDTRFGVVINDCAVAFSTLSNKKGVPLSSLSDSRSYLADLPESEIAGKALLAWGEAHFAELPGGECPRLTEVRLETPIEVASLFDFGLTPRHLRNSSQTWIDNEKDDPITSGLVQMFASRVAQERPKPPPGELEVLPHYKCNMNAIVGDDVTVPWPSYTEYLDVEPELAVVYGNSAQPVAGYCIFNDVSARDVQPPELIGGFCLSKDLAQGNQLGPYLVTSDEVGNAFDLSVNVTVNGKPRFSGTTSEISREADDVFAWLGSIAPLRPGSVMGFGTIPDCTGLDNGEFLDPGDEVTITFERLGTLHCRLAEPTQQVRPSRWAPRPELDAFRGA